MGHITVDGADDDLRNALAIASDGVHRAQSRALSVASRAGVSLQTRDKCGSGRLRLATDGPGPGERQERRGGELRAGNSASWHLLSATRSYADSPASQLTTSPSLLLSRPRPISSRPEVSETALNSGLQAHTGSWFQGEGSRLSPVDPIRGDCEGFPEVIIGANDRDTSRSAALMHQSHGCSHNM